MQPIMRPMPTRHFESSALIPAPAEIIFEYLDDPRRIGAHMGKPSWRMGGGAMQYEFDAAQGRAVGAKIRLSGNMLGLQLMVDALVTHHEAPLRKVWKTIGTPRLLVIGAYKMGFDIEPGATGSRLRIYMDYSLPTGVAWLLGWFFGALYARWCVRSMVADAARRFSPPRR